MYKTSSAVEWEKTSFASVFCFLWPNCKIDLFPLWLSVRQILGLERFFGQGTALSPQNTIPLMP